MLPKTLKTCPPFTRAQVQALLHAGFAQAEICAWDNQWTTRDGHVVHVDARWTILDRDMGGKIDGGPATTEPDLSMAERGDLNELAHCRAPWPTEYGHRHDYTTYHLTVWVDAISQSGDMARLKEADVEHTEYHDHTKWIATIMRHEPSCGDDPDDHTWTGEGGCKENPGVRVDEIFEGFRFEQAMLHMTSCDAFVRAQLSERRLGRGGTKLLIIERCAHCALRRTMNIVGSQHKYGEVDTVLFEKVR